MDNLYQNLSDLLNDYAQWIFVDIDIDVIYNISEVKDDVTAEDGFVITATASEANEPIATLYIPRDFETSNGCEVFNNVYFNTIKALSPLDVAFDAWSKEVIATSKHFTRAGLTD